MPNSFICFVWALAGKVAAQSSPRTPRVTAIRYLIVLPLLKRDGRGIGIPHGGRGPAVVRNLTRRHDSVSGRSSARSAPSARTKEDAGQTNRRAEAGGRCPPTTAPYPITCCQSRIEGKPLRSS